MKEFVLPKLKELDKGSSDYVTKLEAGLGLAEELLIVSTKLSTCKHPDAFVLEST